MNSSPALKRSVLLVASLGLVCTEASANPLDSLYVAPAIYYASPDSKLAADHDFGVQLSVGTYLSSQWQAELVSEATKFKRDDGTDTYKQAGASVQAIFSPLDDLAVRPLIIGGFGWLHTSANTGGDNRPLARAGTGLQWAIPDTSWDIRGTAVWRHEFSSQVVSPSSDLNTIIYSIGVSYRFGDHHASLFGQPSESTTQSSIEPEHSAVRKHIDTTAAEHNSNTITAPDQDADGVPDAQDKCPDTPRSAIVDADGCPIRLK